jgi:hypothetical protein
MQLYFGELQGRPSIGFLGKSLPKIATAWQQLNFLLGI